MIAIEYKNVALTLSEEEFKERFGNLEIPIYIEIRENGEIESTQQLTSGQLNHIVKEVVNSLLDCGYHYVDIVSIEIGKVNDYYVIDVYGYCNPISMKLTVGEFTFEYAHRIPNHEKCSNLHGHTGLFTISVEIGPIDTMLIDFGVLKKVAKQIENIFDHKYIGDDISEVKHVEIGPEAESIVTVIAELFFYLLYKNHKDILKYINTFEVTFSEGLKNKVTLKISKLSLYRLVQRNIEIIEQILEEGDS